MEVDFDFSYSFSPSRRCLTNFYLNKNLEVKEFVDVYKEWEFEVVFRFTIQRLTIRF